MGIEFERTYLSFKDEPTELTDNEIGYFRSVVDGFAPVMTEFLGCVLHITNRDHEKMEKSHKEALGIFYTADKLNLTDDAYITVDNYFIHECYEVKYNNWWNISQQSLEEVIAHEIAHAIQFRHCKRHRELTKKILARYMELRGE